MSFRHETLVSNRNIQCSPVLRTDKYGATLGELGWGSSPPPATPHVAALRESSETSRKQVVPPP